MKSADTGSNDSVTEYGYDEYLQKIATRTEDTSAVISSLYLPQEEANKINNQLTNYVYIDHPDSFICGSHVRWICLKNPDSIQLKKGGIFCNMSKQNCVCKTYLHRHIQFNFNECLVFQKINTQYQQMAELFANN